MSIETAVMEDLLEKLLKETQANGIAQANALAKIAKSAGIDSKTVGDAQTKLKKLGDAAEEGAKQVSSFASSAGKVAGAVLGDLVSGLASTVGNLAAFSAKAMSGAASLSDLAMSFKDLPLIGAVVPFFASLLKIQEENLKAYRELAKSGVNFGQSLNELRTTAVSLGLNLDQFNKMITSSVDAFVLMGTTANDGAKNFKSINLELTRSGGVGEQLRNLGYGFEEMNLLTASYVRVTGGLSKKQQQDYQGVAAAVAEYGKELDLIARITGRSREQQEKELEEQMKEANFQAFLSGQDDKTRKKLQLAVNEALANAGKGGADIVKASAMGLVAQSEQSAALYSLAGDAGETLTKMGKDAMNKNVALTDFQADSAKRLGTVVYQLGTAYRGNEITFNAMAQGGDKLAETFGVAARAATTLNNNNITTIDEAQANALKEAAIARHESETRSSSLSAALTLEETMRKLNEAFSKLAVVLIDKLVNPLINELGKITPQQWEDFTKGIIAFAENVANWVPKLFNEKGRQEIIDALKDALVGIVKSSHQAAIDHFLGANGKIKIESKLGEKSTDPTGANARTEGAKAMFHALYESLFGSDEPKSAPKNKTFGSYGTTGQLFENFGNGTDVTLHGTEGVFTPQQIQAIMDGTASNKLKDTLDELNTINKQILQHMMAVAENTGRTVDATNALNGNMLA
jgi:hypothetical protein